MSEKGKKSARPKKRVKVVANLPDLEAGHTCHEATGEGGSVKTALKNAVERMWRSPNIKETLLKGGSFTWRVLGDQQSVAAADARG